VAISKIGMIIRRRRTELGLSQEDLADGICAVTTLSRIENGERMPTQNHLEMLLQRVGYSDMMLENYVDEEDFLAHDLRFKIRQAHIEGNTEVARGLLLQLESLGRACSKLDSQFIMLHNILLFPERYTNESRLRELEKALRITHPKYTQDNILYLLSYEEVVLLNNIATAYATCGQRKVAVDILYGIINYYDTHIVNIEENLRTETMTIYNLSKWLGLENRYNECIKICDRGIALAKKTGRASCFALTLYNKAWALVKRNEPNDRAEAKTIAQNAYHVALAFDNMSLAESCQRFIKSNNLE